MKSCCMHLLLFFIFLYWISAAYAQQHNNRWYSEIKLDNDYLNYRLAGTDRYYTNGVFMNVMMPRKKTANFFKGLFFKHTTDVQSLAAAGLYQLTFTPNDIKSITVSNGDYPYIGLLAANYSTIFNSQQKLLRITSTFHAATMGKFSLAEEGQKLVHILIHYQLPNGWDDNEVNKTLLFNYDLLMEKGLAGNNKWLQLIPNALVRLGMIETSLSAGATVQLGLREDYFSYIKSCWLNGQALKKLRVYFTWQPSFKYIAWNGLLEPGVEKNIRTYGDTYKVENAYPAVKRFLFKNTVSIFFHFKNTRIGFSQIFMPAELSTTLPHEIGSLSVAYRW